jgi:hypothetical protein
LLFGCQLSLRHNSCFTPIFYRHASRFITPLRFSSQWFIEIVSLLAHSRLSPAPLMHSRQRFRYCQKAPAPFRRLFSAAGCRHYLRHAIFAIAFID